MEESFRNPTPLFSMLTVSDQFLYLVRQPFEANT
jgi:hypothetical protein